MKRDLFIFAGQSNMMGAAVYPPKTPLQINHSFEYKHKPRRLGALCGAFLPARHPAGEFSYADLSKAYAPENTDQYGNSLLNNYVKNAYFCPAMSSLSSNEPKTSRSFADFLEANASIGVTLAPFFAEEWEKEGRCCTYAHIAKGGVAAAYFFPEEMKQEYAARIKAYNQTYGTTYQPDLPPTQQMTGAADYFFQKCNDFLEDAEKRFIDEPLGARCFFWLQGESDANRSATEYEIKLEILWERLKQVGFTHFCCIRVDYFGSPAIYQVMQAQENFTTCHPDAYMLTRAASFFPHPEQEIQNWFETPPSEEYRQCRDSYFGFNNQHINEKGFRLLATRAAKNLYRILKEGKDPILEQENIRLLK